MVRYKPRHAFFYSEPDDKPARRRLVVARLAIGVVLVGAALVLASAFNGNTHSPKGPSASVSADTDVATGHNDLKTKRARGTAHSPKAALGTTKRQGSSPGKAAASGKGEPDGPAGPGTVHTAAKGHQLTADANSNTGAEGPASPAIESAPAQALTTPPGFGPLLRRVWVAADPGGAGLTSADVQATKSGTVYYAGQPSVGAYWSLSQFLPTPAAQGQAELAQFRLGGVFYKAPGRAWAYLGHFPAGGCPTQVPATVLGAWGICAQVGS